MTTEVYHKCRICGKNLLQQSKNLKKHIKNHSLTLEQYFEEYIKGDIAPPVVSPYFFIALLENSADGCLFVCEIIGVDKIMATPFFC